MEGELFVRGIQHTRVKDWNATFVSTLKVSNLYIMHLLQTNYSDDCVRQDWDSFPLTRDVSSRWRIHPIYFESIVPVTIPIEQTQGWYQKNVEMTPQSEKDKSNFRQWTGASQLVDLLWIDELSNRREECQKFTQMIFHSRCRSRVDVFRLNSPFLNYPAIYICRAPQSPLFSLARIFFLCCTVG